MLMTLLALVGCPEPPTTSGGPGAQPGMAPGGPGGGPGGAPGGAPPAGGGEGVGGGPPPGGAGGGEPPPFNGEPQFTQDALTAENSVAVAGTLTCEDSGPWRLLLFPPPPEDPQGADPSDPPQPYALLVVEAAGAFSFKGPKGEKAVVMAFPDPEGLGTPSQGGMFFANDAKEIDLSADITDLELDCTDTVDGGPPPPGGAGGAPGEGPPGAEGGEAPPLPEGGSLPPPEGGEMPPPEGGEMPPPPEGEMKPPLDGDAPPPSE